MKYNILEVGKRIQKLRREKGLTQEQLANCLSISTVHLAKIESGKRGCSMDILIDISAVLSASLDYLVHGKVLNNDVRARLDAVIQILVELRKDM